MSAPATNTGLSSALDASRWIAALMVVVSHIHHLVLANYVDVIDRSLLWKGLYFLGSFGGESVIIFFVVSGYLVGGSTALKWIRQSTLGQPPQMRDYATHRVARIYTVLLPALLAGWAFDSLGARYFDGAHLYTNAQQYHTISLANVIVVNLGLPVLLGNLLMLENIAVSVLGSNGPLWSLAYEWWYYCIFAVAMGALLYRGAYRWICLAVMLMALLLLPGKLVIWMSVWLLGLAAFYYVLAELPRPNPLFGLGVLLVVLTICRFNHAKAESGVEPLLNQFIRDFGLGLAYTFALVGFSRLKRPLWMAQAHTRLASFSYSLYLTHFPMMVLVAAVLDSVLGIRFLGQPSALRYLYLLGILALLYGYGFVFSLATERQTAAVRATLSALLARPQRQPALSAAAESRSSN